MKTAITVTVSPAVYGWFASIPTGKRSETVDHVLLKHIGRPKQRELPISMMSREQLDARGLE